jgi:hypothetical protein
MSLISARNLVAPLKNKVHIVTIVLCAIAFAVLRMSGAGFSTGPRANYTPAVSRPANVNNYRPQQNSQPSKIDDNKALLDIEKELGL